MAIGPFGGYGPPIAGADYPVGPISWPAGQSWPLNPGGFLYPVDLNQQLSAAVAFLSRKPMFKGAQQTSQSIANNTATALTLDTEIADAWGMHSNGLDTSQVIVPTGCDGVWLVEGQVTYTSPASPAAGDYGSAAVVYNGTAIPGQRAGLDSSGAVIMPQALDLIAASAGDTFQLQAQQTTGATISTAINQASSSIPTGSVPYYGGYYPFFNCRWIAANNSVPGGVIGVPFLQGDGSWSANQSMTLTPPHPGTWSNLQQITSAQFNSDILISVLFLSNVPFMRAIVSGSPAAVPSGTATQVTGLASTLDNWGTFAGNTWTCPLGGLYLVSGLVGYAGLAAAYSNDCYISASISGITTGYLGSVTEGGGNASGVTRVLRFSAGDTVQLYSLQNSGSSITPQTGASTRLITLWLST